MGTLSHYLVVEEIFLIKHSNEQWQPFTNSQSPVALSVAKMNHVKVCFMYRSSSSWVPSTGHIAKQCEKTTMRAGRFLTSLRMRLFSVKILESSIQGPCRCITGYSFILYITVLNYRRQSIILDQIFWY